MWRAAVGLLALGALHGPLAAQTTVVVGVGGDLSALRGQDLLVPVFADMRNAGGEKLGSYTIRVSWDTTVLRFKSVEAGTFAELLWRSDSAYARGVLWLTGISAQGAGGLLDLARVRLYVRDSLATAINLSVTELSAAGTLTDLLSSVTPVGGTFCPARGRWGDLDGGKSLFGTADSRDALLILSSVVGLQLDPRYDLSMGDVDGDGRVNTRDALIILSYAVGIPVPGHRVLLVAGGACASQVPPSIVVVPDTVDLVGSLEREVHQDVRLHALARTAAGNLVSLTGVNWASANPLIAFVSADGEAFAVDTGTTTITAGIGPGITITVPAIVRPRRRVWHVDAPRAKQASVQVGTLKWPFSTPERAFGLVTEGDTIRVAPGIHDYENLYQELRAGAVIIGDTLADGTRPVLRSREFDYNAGVYWEGGVRGEIRNLVLRGFWAGAYLYGLRNLFVENVRIEEPRSIYGYGIISDARMDTLSVRRSTLVGDSLRYNYYGLAAFDGARLLRVDSSRFEFWRYEAIYGYHVDSTDLVGNHLQSNGYGLELYGPDDEPSLRAGLRNNRFLDHTYGAVYMYAPLRVWFRDNYLLQRNAYYADAIEIYGAYPPRAGTKVSFAGDSIQMRSWYARGMYLDDLDSVLIDRLWYQLPPDTALGAYNDVYANTLQITNSHFLNLYYEAMDFYGRELVVDNTQATGCAVCNRNAYGFRAWAGNDSGPKVTLTNSSFFNMYSGLEMFGSDNGEGPVLATGNTIDSVTYGININADSVVISDNVIRNVRTKGVWVWPSFTTGRPFVTARVLRNQVSCLGTGSRYGINVDYGPTQIDSNTVTGCVYGIRGYNTFSYPLAPFNATGNAVTLPSTAYYHVGIRPDGRWQPTITGNRVTGGYIGIDLTITDTAAAVVDSNVVSGTGQAGIAIWSVNGAVAGRKNNVANNLVDGIYNYYGSGTRSFTLGRFVGNGWYGVRNVGGSTVVAQQNWWGNAAGAGGGVADSVSGSVDASNPLGADPGDVPALAPQPAIAEAALVFRPDVTNVAAPSPAATTADASTKLSSRPDAGSAGQAARRPASEAEHVARGPITSERAERDNQRAEMRGQLDAARRFWEAKQAERERTRPRLPR